MSKNRILSQAAARYEMIYADSAERAQELGNTQRHSHGFMLISRCVHTLDLTSVIDTLRIDVEACRLKLTHDSPNIQCNMPILFRTNYRMRDDVLNGKDVFGVLLTGQAKRIITPKGQSR